MFALLGKKPAKKKKKSSRWAGPVLAIAVLIGLLDGGKHAITGSFHPGVHATSLSGTLNCAQLEQLWEDAGGSSSGAFLAAEVAEAESSGHQYAVDDDGNGTEDFGYWQINTVHYPVDFDPLRNAEEAVAISGDGSNWLPWVTYDKRREVGQC